MFKLRSKLRVFVSGKISFLQHLLILKDQFYLTKELEIAEI